MFGIEPWHLWGSEQIVAPIVTGITGAVPFSTSQLAKVNYGRPETWSFLFSATVLEAPDTGGGTLNIFVAFDLTVGLGRTSVSMPVFCAFQMSYLGVPANIVGRQKYTTAVLAPLLDETGTSAFRPTLDRFPAQDIQCNGRANAAIGSGPAIGSPVKINLEAFFAPVGHVRPEWFTDNAGNDSRFRGHEQSGT